jgi:hypothetical protein
MKNKNSSGMAALILIISLVLAVILIVIVINYYTGGSKGEQSIQSPIDRAKNVTCLAQRHNIEIIIRYYSAEESKYPSDLRELMKYSSDLTDKSFQCPVTGNPYNYDPQTGKVTCPDHP